MQRSRVRTRKPKIVFLDLDKDRVWGWAYQDKFMIELDKKMRQRKYLEIFLHEHLHCALPDASEACVLKLARMLSDGLWNSGYRRSGKQKIKAKS